MKTNPATKHKRCFRWVAKADEYGRHCDKIPGEMCPRDVTRDCWETKKRKCVKPSI